MARFIRDEKKTYPFAWLTIGGLFAMATAGAVYAELVTRVPWQKNQQAYFDMELEQANQALARSQAEWAQQIEPALKAKLARKAEIETSMASGDYKQAKDRLDKLTAEYNAAEVGKTFGSSDLDEAYYYRNLAEYERDRAMNAVREIYHEAFAAEGPRKGDELADKMYANVPAPPQGEWTAKRWHLEAEVVRMEGHIAQIKEAIGGAPSPAAKKSLANSQQREQEVVERLKVEIVNQNRVDDALAKMVAVDGPAEPALSEKDPQKRAEERTKERARVCAGREDTRSCIRWNKLDPVDAEFKAIEVEIAKNRRALGDAELRAARAETRARPKFDVQNVVKSLVGPFQIQQVVTHWLAYERDVDQEQVDRCQTCHMGADNNAYTSAAIPRQFRTHPHRSELFSVHPVEKFGCTSCHQGQGRATDSLAHSGWKLEDHHGEERWHFQGDHYWEDPMLPIGALRRIIVDEANDEFAVKVPGVKKWEDGLVKLEHRSPAEHLVNEEIPAEYETEEQLFGVMQEQVQALVEKDGALAKRWHAVVRKLDNRVQIGLEQNDPTEIIPAKEMPTVGLRINQLELGNMLGFRGAVEIAGKQPLVTAPNPPAASVRSEGMASVDKQGRYHPPRGAEGLQVPDDMRNRFIQALPEVESGCLRCHQTDTDLKVRGSQAKFVNAKLDYERAEAARKADPDGYKKAHDGVDELPSVVADPAQSADPVPTFTEGRALFKKLNCTGCHILENYAWDKNAGPALDNITAKVSPEWILTWIRNPRGWRAKTRMPNLWPRPLDPASKRPYPQGSPEFAKWEAQMRDETVAVASYLVERSDNPRTRTGAAKDAQPLKNVVKGYAEVPDATAEKGKEYFEAYGCQGCHATSEENLPDAWKNRERDIAPTLSNLAGKTTADWIAYWVEEPNRYWHGTKMPNLRLSRVEAASIGKYLATMKEEPISPASVEAGDVTLVTDPAKRVEKVACRVAGGAQLSRVDCGERVVAHYGCFGCHNISGFEKYSAIAPELGGWAKKDISTLDFGYAISEHHLQTTETYATLKLDSPRIVRRDRIEVKMGDYDLSPREIRSLVTFLKGLVPAKPKEAYNPVMDANYSAAIEGRQIVEDYNCRGCHMLEGRGADIDGFRQAQLAADAQARAPFLNGDGMRVQPEWLFSFLRAPGEHGIRPWLHPEWAWKDGDVPADKRALRMPTFNFTPEQVTALVRYFATWDGQEYPYQAVAPKPTTEQERLYALTHMLAADAANCLSCHYQGEFPVERGQRDLAKMAPNWNNIPHRLRPEWVKAWLLRPQNWLPYTKMTAFWASTDREKTATFFPDESDPFRSKPLAWNKVEGFSDITTERQVELVRDFLFSIPQDAVFPAAGEEASSPLVKGTSSEAAMPKRAEQEPQDKAKGVDKKKKKTGALQGPARF